MLTQAAQAYGEGRIGVEIVETPRPAVAARMKRAAADQRKGKNVSPEFDSAADAIRWMRAV